MAENPSRPYLHPYLELARLVHQPGPYGTEGVHSAESHHQVSGAHAAGTLLK